MMKHFWIYTTLFSILIGINARDYVITEYGVSSDSSIINTLPIQQVIDKAYTNGGGTIVIPEGIFLSGALFFKPGTKLHLLKGAILKGSDNISDYPLIPSRMEGQCQEYYAALVNAYHVDSFSIAGPGVIDGNGLKYWKQFWAYRDSMKSIKKSATNLEVHRPRLVFIWACNNVSIINVTLKNAGFWTTHLYKCNHVNIEKAEIYSPYKPVPAPSTDGIDIDVCSNVVIRACRISVNDDAVCIKGGKGPDAHKLPENGVVENILIEDCIFGDSHGTLTLGSESVFARNIIMRNCKVESKTPLLRLKMRPDTYQTFENISIENITGSCGSLFTMKPWKQFFDLKGSTSQPKGLVRNIVLKDIKMNCNIFGEIAGNPLDSTENILFKNIEILAKTDTLNTIYKNSIRFENVIVNKKIYEQR